MLKKPYPSPQRDQAVLTNHLDFSGRKFSKPLPPPAKAKAPQTSPNIPTSTQSSPRNFFSSPHHSVSKVSDQFIKTYKIPRITADEFKWICETYHSKTYTTYPVYTLYEYPDKNNPKQKNLLVLIAEAAGIKSLLSVGSFSKLISSKNNGNYFVALHISAHESKARLIKYINYSSKEDFEREFENTKLSVSGTSGSYRPLFNHPSTPTFIIELPFFTGTTLKELLMQITPEERPIPALALLTMLLLKEMLILHQKKLEHGNITPANIIYDPKRKKLCFINYNCSHRFFGKSDFYLAQDLHYLAPENFLPCLRTANGRNDIFALGMIICELYGNRTIYNKRDSLINASAISFNLKTSRILRNYYPNTYFPPLAHAQVKTLVNLGDLVVDKNKLDVKYFKKINKTNPVYLKNISRLLERMLSAYAQDINNITLNGIKKLGLTRPFILNLFNEFLSIILYSGIQSYFEDITFDKNIENALQFLKTDNKYLSILKDNNYPISDLSTPSTAPTYVRRFSC